LQRSIFMNRLLLVVIWAAIIFIFTCTERMEDIFEHLSIVFVLDAKPNFQELLFPLPSEIGPEFILRKMGHGLCFLIFTLLLARLYQNRLMSIGISLLYACATEFFQLYFSRDGRLFDVGFDSLGILTAIILLSIPSKQISLTRKSQT
jgi:VanZ family protein